MDSSAMEVVDLTDETSSNGDTSTLKPAAKPYTAILNTQRRPGASQAQGMNGVIPPPNLVTAAADAIAVSEKAVRDAANQKMPAASTLTKPHTNVPDGVHPNGAAATNGKRATAAPDTANQKMPAQARVNGQRTTNASLVPEGAPATNNGKRVAVANQSAVHDTANPQMMPPTQALLPPASCPQNQADLNFAMSQSLAMWNQRVQTNQSRTNLFATMQHPAFGPAVNGAAAAAAAMNSSQLSAAMDGRQAGPQTAISITTNGGLPSNVAAAGLPPSQQGATTSTTTSHYWPSTNGGVSTLHPHPAPGTAVNNLAPSQQGATTTTSRYWPSTSNSMPANSAPVPNQQSGSTVRYYPNVSNGMPANNVTASVNTACLVNEPKRPRSSYIFFNFDMRPKILSEFPGIQSAELCSIMGERWRALTPHERKKYQDLAAQDKIRFDREMEKYKAVAPHIPPQPILPHPASAAASLVQPPPHVMNATHGPPGILPRPPPAVLPNATNTTRPVDNRKPPPTADNRKPPPTAMPTATAMRPGPAAAGSELRFYPFIELKKYLLKANANFLNLVDAFVLTLDDSSPFPHSQLLTSHWKRLHGDNDDKTRMVAGACCRACVSPLQLSNNEAVQFIDEDLYQALVALRRHVLECPKIHKRARLAELSTNLNVQLEAYAKLFSASGILDCGEKITKCVPWPRMTIHNLAQFVEKERKADRVHEDLDACMSQAMLERRRRRPPGVLAQDLTALPCSESMIDYPYLLEFLEHVEIVYVTTQRPMKHAQLLQKQKVDSLVLFQCRHCHGAGAHAYAIHQSSNFVADLIGMLYCHACIFPEKRKLLPKPGSPEMKGMFHLVNCRADEWNTFVDKKLSVAKLGDMIGPREDPGVWLPLPPNELLQHDNLWQSTTPKQRESDGITVEHCRDDNNYVEGFDGAWDCIGNRRFRVLVASLRKEYKEMEDKYLVAKKVVDEVESRGGAFLFLHQNGLFHRMERAQALLRARDALERGFSHLDRAMYTGSRRVSEVEEAPKQNILNGKVRSSRPRVEPTQPSSAGSIAAKRKYIELVTSDMCRFKPPALNKKLRPAMNVIELERAPLPEPKKPGTNILRVEEARPARRDSLLEMFGSG